MDDLIWQDDHWVDRSALLKEQPSERSKGAGKVVLLSLDRNRESSWTMPRSLLLMHLVFLVRLKALRTTSGRLE